MSNSEVDGGKGGVFGLYFDDNDNVVDYKELLSGTTRNCSGGKSKEVQLCPAWISTSFLHVVLNQSFPNFCLLKGATPWKTWVSCEEYGKGQCWQVDPDPSSEHHLKPEETKLGGAGGSYESVACDNRWVNSLPKASDRDREDFYGATPAAVDVSAQ